jgi:hypothetical protein
LLTRWEDAEAHFARALHDVEAVPDRLDEPRVQYWYARMLVDRGEPGDREKARALFEKSLEGYRRLGMPLHVGWAEARLQSL